MKIAKDPRKIWEEYERGREYNTHIELYKNVEDNEDFFTGNQWKGCNAPDMPKPVLNFLKRVVTYIISVIVSDDISFVAEAHEDTPDNKIMSLAVAKQIHKIIERTKFKKKLRSAIRNAAVDGDACLFVRFDPNIDTGKTYRGDIVCDLVENMNVMFGNPHNPEAQEQPYIIIAQRKPVSELRDEAREYGASESEVMAIVSDSDAHQMEKGESDTLATKLTKLWRENGTIWVTETTQTVTIRKPFDTKYKLYPLCWMPYEETKSSYHGRAVITGLIPNQIEVNRLMAAYMVSVQTNAFPKVIYDSEKIKNWTSKPGVAVAAKNLGVSRVTDWITSIRGGDVSYQVMDVVDNLVSMTRDFMGANDAALGNVKPDNTSAIIAVQQGATMPLQIQRMNMYQLVEDFIRICLDIMRVDYGEREVILDEAVTRPVLTADGRPAVDEAGNPIVEEITRTVVDYSGFNDVNYSLNVDVGASSYFSELIQMQTMDNLLQLGLVDEIIYLESAPNKYIPNKAKIVQAAKDRKEQMLQMAQQQQQIIQPPDLESQVAAARAQIIGG